MLLPFIFVLLGWRVTGRGKKLIIFKPGALIYTGYNDINQSFYFKIKSSFKKNNEWKRSVTATTGLAFLLDFQNTKRMK